MKNRILWMLILLIGETALAQLKPNDLIADLDQLKEIIESKHPNPYWINTKKDFDRRFEESKTKIALKSTCDESCYIEMFKALAILNDGHSSISSGTRYDLFGYLPFTASWFDGKLYITKTIKPYENILGFHITKVNNTDIEEVLRKLKEIIPQANDSRFHKFVGSYIHLPGILYGLGITDNPKKALFTFSDGEKTISKEINDLPADKEKETVFISYLDNKKDLPYFQRDNDKYYWFEYNENNKLLYFQYNRVGNMKTESSTQFANRLWATVDSVQINKFVLDLRYNGGGSFPYSLKFVQGILDRPKINKRGKLFIITGYDTFSAAIDMLNQIELRSQAIIIGEPPCDHPSGPGDPKSFVLENSKMKVYISSLFHPTLFPDDQRKSTYLDKEIITKWSDFKKGNDPNLNYILTYSTDKNKLVKAKKGKKIIGNYNYSKTRNIEIKDVEGQLWMDISHGLVTPLYKVSKNVFNTEIVGLKVAFENDKIKLSFPDGKSSNYDKKTDSFISAINFIYNGKVNQAEMIFKKLKKENPTFKEFEDHNMSFLASLVYFELKNKQNLNASEIAKKVLKLGIALNDGKAPFCEFSLRFY